MSDIHDVTVYCETQGDGADLVLIHGWGLTGAVWEAVMPFLTHHFRVHRIDLPGFGYSQSCTARDLSPMAAACAAVVPGDAYWLGWSLGGLVATEAVLAGHCRAKALIWVGSTPCFVAREAWPGVEAKVFANFASQLSSDYRKTLDRFLAIQVMGSDTAKSDLKLLRQQLALRPEPTAEVLANGLNLLAESDLRPRLEALTVPLIRYYGRLDSLVPQRSLEALTWPTGHQRVFAGAAHAPFISAPESFAQAVIADLLGIG